MRIGIWRMGARFQTSEDSVVGGGRIAQAVLKNVRLLGHTPIVLGGVTKVTKGTLDTGQFEHVPEPSPSFIAGLDACIILTGPWNPLYDALYTTYDRLANYAGKVIYAWWDSALGFNFHPEQNKQFRGRCAVTHEDIMRDKEWHVLTQLDTEVEPGVSLVPCFWELIEAGWGRPMKPHPMPTPSFGYFGSPRPGRLRELKRWFGDGRLPLRLHGKWRPKALEGLPADVFRGPVPERSVRKMLNEFTCTLYAADPQYIKVDFVAQRFIENAMACVPVAYSDKLQPTVRSVVDDDWMFSTVDEMRGFFDRLTKDTEYRVAMALEQQETVLTWAKAHPAQPMASLEGILK